MTQDILVIDDEADIRDLVSGILEDDGHQVRTARDSDEALERYSASASRRWSFSIFGCKAAASTGLICWRCSRSIDADMPVVVISGHGTIETAVAAIRKGAYDFVEKPFTADRLLLVVQRALETTRLKRENTALKARSSASDDLIGSSAVMAALRSFNRSRGANQLARADHRPRRRRQRTCRPPAARTQRPRRRRLRRHQRRLHRARAHGERNLRRRRPGWPPEAKSACSSRPMAAPSSSTKSATCRWRRSRKSCACWSISASSA